MRSTGRLVPHARGIWENVHATTVREDSAEADLFKLLVRGLSTGSVIRQHRDTTANGHFVKKTPIRTPKGYGSRVMKSAFDDIEQYELPELGRQFVHYTMNGVVPRIGGRLSVVIGSPTTID